MKKNLRSYDIEIPHPGDTRWYYCSRTISVLFEKYQCLFDVLESIVENPQGFDDVTLTQTSGLLQYLNSFLFCFLMILFNKILQQSAILYMVLQYRQTDLTYGIGKISNFLDFLLEMRSDESYDSCFPSAVEMVGEPTTRADKKHNYKQLFFQVIDNMANMLKDQFADFKSFEFLDLVNPHFFSQWKDSLPAGKLELFRVKYGPLFNIHALEQQLLFIYRDLDFHQSNSQELLRYINHFHLQTGLSEVYKLLLINASVAVSSASVKRSFSCLRREKTYLRNAMGQERLG